MKVILKQNVRVPMPAGTVVDLTDSQAALLISIGHAEEYKEKPAVRKTAAKTTKK